MMTDTDKVYVGQAMHSSLCTTSTRLWLAIIIVTLQLTLAAEINILQQDKIRADL